MNGTSIDNMPLRMDKGEEKMSPNALPPPGFLPPRLGDDLINNYLVMSTEWLGNKRSWTKTWKLLDPKSFCSFCDKHKRRVKNFIPLPTDRRICNECVDLLNEMIAEEDGVRFAWRLILWIISTGYSEEYQG